MTAGVAIGRDERADPEHEVERSIPGKLGLSQDVLGRRRVLPDRHRQCDVVRERVCDRSGRLIEEKLGSTIGHRPDRVA